MKLGVPYLLQVLHTSLNVSSMIDGNRPASIISIINKGNSGVTSDNGVISDSGVTSDSGVISDSGVTSDSRVTSDNGTTSDGGVTSGSGSLGIVG